MDTTIYGFCEECDAEIHLYGKELEDIKAQTIKALEPFTVKECIGPRRKVVIPPLKCRYCGFVKMQIVEQQCYKNADGTFTYK